MFLEQVFFNSVDSPFRKNDSFPQLSSTNLFCSCFIIVDNMLGKTVHFPKQLLCAIILLRHFFVSENSYKNFLLMHNALVKITIFSRQ